MNVATIRVCNSVCLCVCAIKIKTDETEIANLTRGLSYLAHQSYQVKGHSLG